MITSNLFRRAIVVLATLSASLTVVEPALAGLQAVPAPLLGAGLPGVAVAGGVIAAIWVTRKLRKHE